MRKSLLTAKWIDVAVVTYYLFTESVFHHGTPPLIPIWLNNLTNVINVKVFEPVRVGLDVIWYEGSWVTFRNICIPFFVE